MPIKRRRPLVHSAYQVARRFAPYAGAAVSSALRSRSSRSMTRTRTRNRTFESGVLTNQYDVKRQYRKGRVSRFRRARAKKFKARVQSVIQSDLADNFIVEQSVSSTNSAAGLQNYGWAVMYGGKSGYSTTAAAFGQNDLTRIATGLSDATNNENRIIFKSATLDCQWNADPTNAYTTVLDIYHVIARKDCPQIANVNSIADLFYYGVNDLAYLSPLTAALAASTSGVTPFQSPIFCQNMLILKKDRVLLSPGQSCHRLMRDSKLRKILWDREEAALFNKKGWTQGYLWVANGMAGVYSLSPNISPPVLVNFSAVRTYNCKEINPTPNFGGLA